MRTVRCYKRAGKPAMHLLKAERYFETGKYMQTRMQAAAKRSILKRERQMQLLTAMVLSRRVMTGP